MQSRSENQSEHKQHVFNRRLAPVTVTLSCQCHITWPSDEVIMPRRGDLLWCFSCERNVTVQAVSIQR